MPLKPIEFPGFGGLDLRKDPQEGTAVDVLNVAFDRPGTVRTRPGTTSIYTAAANITTLAKMDPGGGVHPYIVFTTGSNIYVISIYAVVALEGSTATTDGVYSHVGSPVDDVLYYCNGAGVVKKLTETASLSAPAGIPGGTYFVTTQSPDSRLVCSGFGGVVSFSEPADPETFGVDDYVTLPGDVTEVASYNDLVFALNDTGLYVFYGNSTDSTGGTIFNYRLITREVKNISNAIDRCMAAGPDGVYINTETGLYKTTGGIPTKISNPVEPMYEGNAPSLLGYASASTVRAPVFVDSKYLYLDSASVGYFWVLKLDTGEWSLWSTPYNYIVAGVSASSTSTVPIFGSYNGTTIAKLDYAATSDAGTAIVSRYRSGFFNPGPPGTESVIREWQIDGTSSTGAVTFSTSQDDSATLSGASVSVGTSPTMGTGRDRRAVKGRNFSWQIGASSGSWSVSRVIANLRGARATGPES